MKNKPTSAEIIRQADQVIEAEQSRVHPDMRSAYEYGFNLLKTLLQAKTREKNEKLLSLIGELEDAAFYCGDHRESDEKPYSELYEDLWESRDAIRKHLENEVT